MNNRIVKTAEDRFWPKVDMTGECWLWTAEKNRGGYGKFNMGGKIAYAHRAAYEWAIGPIPAGFDLDHKCHTRACVNPAHLRPATRTQNMQNRQGAQSNSTSMVRGITWRKDKAKWHARAMLNRKNHHLGYFRDIAEAEAVVIEWRRVNMPYSLMDQVC